MDHESYGDIVIGTLGVVNKGQVKGAGGLGNKEDN